MAFGKKTQLRELAQQAWILGGAEAFKSLEKELRTQTEAEPDEDIPFPDSSPKGADLLLRLAKGPDPVTNVAMEAGRSLRRDSRPDLAKRLAYRQAVLGAGHLTGDKRNIEICLELESNLLFGEPL